MNMEIFAIIIFIFLLVVGVLPFIIWIIFSFFLFLIPMFTGGAFFAKSGNNTIQKMITLAEIKPGDKTLDLGSGDGSIVIEAAKKGAQSFGYEIDSFLVFVSRKNIKKTGLSNSAVILQKNFWKEDLSSFDTIFVFGIPYMMSRLEKKLKKEMKPGTKIISNGFIFPSWKPVKVSARASLYIV